MFPVSEHDPYAPVMREPAPALPVARLRRLGIPHLAINALMGWWAGLNLPERKAWAASLAVEADADLAADWQAVDELAVGNITQVVYWVENHRIPVVAARVAIAVERGRDDGPRKTLMSKLAEAVKGD